MEDGQVLHMNGGIGDTSYANNSSLQRRVISMTISTAKEAIRAFYTTNCPQKLAIADLGCSSGPNTLLVVTELIKTIDNLCKRARLEQPEYQVFLNDLPGNDFNTIFQSLPNFMKILKKQMDNQMAQMYFMGVPGSFYTRLFPNKSLQFIHSSYSLHWLSQVPLGIEANKGNICTATTSPPSVLQAYYRQFQVDFFKFLRYRAEELVPGGRMVLTFLGRSSEDTTFYISELLAMALGEMVSEGLIIEEDLNSFNIPIYASTLKEVEYEVSQEGSFSIDYLKASEVDWQACESEFDQCGALNDSGYSVAKSVRAVVEPLLIDHFKMEIIEDMFHRYRVHIANHMLKKKAKFTNITVSLVRNT